jgi:glycosyltransferase involved in cell wall biosynthesis
MTISVLVPAYNEAAGLAAALASIRAAMHALADRGWSTELIVCDNNSTDATPVIAAAAGARVVFEPVNQISRARNAAAAVAGGSWFVFVDADTHPSPALFAEAADVIASGRYLAGGSVVRMESSTRFGDLVQALWNTTSRLTGWAAGAFLFVDAAAFRTVGGFSERLYASEEIAFCRRVKRLARRQNRRVVILRRHPLSTSGRKLQLYTPWQMLGLLARTLLTGGRTLRRPQDLFLWYDGRR